jgi:hypothetical protein
MDQFKKGHIGNDVEKTINKKKKSLAWWLDDWPNQGLKL